MEACFLGLKTLYRPMHFVQLPGLVRPKSSFPNVTTTSQRCAHALCVRYACAANALRNIHMLDANTGKLSSMHFHGWKLGLKTGLYYLRTKAWRRSRRWVMTAP